MKGTLMMVAFIATLILTWMFLSAIVYFCSENATFRECAASGGMATLMLIFGWIPSVIVCMDLNDKIDS